MNEWWDRWCYAWLELGFDVAMGVKPDKHIVSVWTGNFNDDKPMVLRYHRQDSGPPAYITVRRNSK